MAPSIAVSFSVCLAVSRHRAVGSRSLSVSFCHPLPHVSHSSADTRADWAAIAPGFSRALPNLMLVSLCVAGVRASIRASEQSPAKGGSAL
eukprot:COSAG02_NODE_56317_length_286_cov_0.754011_1_plen_90_part_10